MGIRLKRLDEQVLVITGATSGIGLVTARMAARRGARLVLVARSEEALQHLAGELARNGPMPATVVADVASRADMERVAEGAKTAFGGFDTWINNAGVSIFGRNEDVPQDDQRRLFETNYWGVVNGSLVAVAHLRGRGGALVNLGSELSDHAVPLQGAYAASKHAVKAFTDSLRMELEEEGVPVSVTLIKPAAIDTMFVRHAKNFMDVEPRLPPPIYAPEVVAEAILFAAEHPKRDLYVGAASRILSSSAHYAPRLLDKLLERFMFRNQRSDQPARDRDDNSLHGPQHDLRERQGHAGHTMESSLYTRASMHPLATLAIVAGVGIAGWLLWRGMASAPPASRLDPRRAVAALRDATGRSGLAERIARRVNGRGW